MFKEVAMIKKERYVSHRRHIYKCPGAEEGMGNLEHLHMDELGFIWEFINGELGCGEHVSNASAAKYRSQLARYRIRNQRER